jgi:parallel beta-helix repeat protein
MPKFSERKARQYFISTLLLAGMMFISSVNTIHAQTSYYLDADNGNDNASGNSEQSPWKTLGKLNSQFSKLKPGDNVRLKRGNVFQGHIEIKASGSVESPINIGAYGSGTKPAINGGVKVSGWSQYSGNIYKASFSQQARNVYINERPLILARTPNQGTYFTVESGAVNNLVCPDLVEPDNYWAGAHFLIRTTNYTWEDATVIASTNDSLTVKPISFIYGIRANLIFYLENLLSALDQENEWYYGNQFLYVCFASLADTSNIYASIDEDGIKGSFCSNLQIENLRIEKFYHDGILLKNAPNTIINSCDIQNIGVTGVDLQTGSNITVSGNTVDDCNGKGISGTFLKGSKFINNTITNTALFPGHGKYGYDGAVGVFLDDNGDNNTIKGNTIISTGYSGIRSDAPHTLIENNIIKNVLLTMKDGGAIYVWGKKSLGTTIRRNYIENINRKEPYPAYQSLAFGIYMDDRSLQNIIRGNVIKDTATVGIFLHNSIQNLVDSNVVYGPGLNIIIDDPNFDSPTYDNTAVNNVFFATDGSYESIKLSSVKGTAFGTFDNNYYVNPYKKENIQYRYNNQTSYLTLSQWQALHGQDTYSKESYVLWDHYVVTDTLSQNLITNGAFDKDLSSWTSEPKEFSVTWAKDGKMNGGYAKMKFASSNGYFGRFFTNETFDYQKDQYYLLTADLESSDSGKFYLRDEFKNPKQFEKRVPVEPKLNKYKLIFKAKSTYMDHVVFGTNDYFNYEIYIDNVALYSINTEYVSVTQRSVLLSNTSDQPIIYKLNERVAYYDLDGHQIKGLVKVDPWDGVILINPDVPVPYPTDTSVDISDIIIKAYPNPTFGMVTIDINIQDLSLNHAVYVYDMKGKLIESKNITSFPISLNLSNFTADLYIVKIVSGATTKTFKIIKK